MDTALVVVSVLSTTAAVTSSAIAWRLAREDRRRSEARIAALTADIHGMPEGSTLFVAADQAGHRSRPLFAMGVGALVVGAVVWAVVARQGPRQEPSTTTDARLATTGYRRPTLELVALGHERDGDRLTVRGVVRNPAGGVAVNGLTAVVLVFNRNGDFMTTGRTALNTAVLGPGAEAGFLVTVAGAADVGRYRVSFRQDGHTIPHVDTRS
jgi:hypothetical protein